jgi:pilus assembly protein CpaB
MIFRDQPYVVAMVAALIAGIVAVVGATIWIKDVESNKVIKVVVASHNIAAGETLTQENISLSERSGPGISLGSLYEVTPLLNRIAKSDMLSGDAIKEVSLVPLVIDGSLAAVITPGKRAYSLKITEEAGVAGFILPGNYVDIILASKESNSKSISKFLLENILVLAIAQERNKANRSEPKVVSVITLEISPDEAEKLDLARNTGNLTLVLRNQVDKVKLINQVSEPINSGIVAHRNNSVAQVYQQRPYASVEVIRGITRGSE